MKKLFKRSKKKTTTLGENLGNSTSFQEIEDNVKGAITYVEQTAEGYLLRGFHSGKITLSCITHGEQDSLTLQKICTFQFHKKPILYMKKLNEQLMLSVDKDQRVCTWNMLAETNKRLVSSFTCPNFNVQEEIVGTTPVALVNDKYLAMCNTFSVELLDLYSGELKYTTKFNPLPVGLRSSPAGDLYVVTYSATNHQFTVYSHSPEDNSEPKKMREVECEFDNKDFQHVLLDEELHLSIVCASKSKLIKSLTLYNEDDDFKPKTFNDPFQNFEHCGVSLFANAKVCFWNQPQKELTTTQIIPQQTLDNSV